jgi:predicted outer membrane repeat protein
MYHPLSGTPLYSPTHCTIDVGWIHLEWSDEIVHRGPVEWVCTSHQFSLSRVSDYLYIYIYICYGGRMDINMSILCERLFSPTHSSNDCLAKIFLPHSNRVSNGSGGAINTLQASELHVEYSSFRNNFAVSGGAINSMGDLYVLETSFSNNVGIALVRNKRRIVEGGGRWLVRIWEALNQHHFLFLLFSFRSGWCHYSKRTQFGSQN